MTERGRMRTWGLAAAGLGVAAALTAAVVHFAGPGRGGKPGVAKAAVLDAATSTRELAGAVARGDGMALAILKARFDEKPKPDAPPPADLTDGDVEELTEVLKSLRAGLSRFSAYGRASAVVVASEALQRLSTAKAPAGWADTLAPAAEVLVSGLSDEVWEVRVAALGEVKGFWTWNPQRDLLQVEVGDLTAWKENLYRATLPHLGDREPKARTAAVACLGALPLNAQAAPAVRIGDENPGVRLQSLISFAERPALLSEEAILPLLYDPDPYIPPIAERILKARGLTPDLIGLGKLVAHPRPDMRASAIPFLKDRKDVDPVVWLIYLSRDADESVRLQAIESLAGRDDPEVKTRLAEMAGTDTSPKVRQAAAKLTPAADATAALPPLPTSGVGLKLKAN